MFFGRKIEPATTRPRFLMSKIRWEYELVERPFCGPLKAMGWRWIGGDTGGEPTDPLIGRVRVSARIGYCHTQQPVLPFGP